MNSTDLLKQIISRIKKGRIFILVVGVLMSLLALSFARSKRVQYTAKATVFPLTSPSDNAISNSMLSGILGLSEAPKSFSNEATINIIELALSRNIREQLAMTRLPAFGNKTIADLLIDDINDNQSLFSSRVKKPTDSAALAITAAEVLKPSINAKMSKNGVLELFYSGTQEQLVTPICNVLIEKLSKFYVDLKRRKAQDDYNFTLDKIDSLQKMIDRVNGQAIGLQQHSLFTPSDLLQYAIPKDDVSSEKARILRQRDMYINNRDEAVWRLQKVTPIIAVLDHPHPPFEVTSQPIALMMVLGFILGSILCTVVLIGRLLGRYIKEEIYKGLIGKATI